MKKKAILSLLFLLLIFCVCSDKNSTSPSDVDEKLLASVTIGTEGGTLTSERFSLKVPAGALTAPVELKLYQSEQQSPLGDGAITDLFQVDGIPFEYSKSLTIVMKHNGDISGTGAVAIGEQLYVKSLDATKTSYRLISAKDSSGYLVCQLSVPLSDPAKQMDLKKNFNNLISDETLHFQGTDFFKTVVSSQGHFRIETSDKAVTNEHLTDLGNNLEEAYTTFNTIGFKHGEKRSWPVEVTVLKLDDEICGYYSYSMFNGGSMEFNSDNLSDKEELRLTAGHEFFHLVQGLYDNRISYTKSRFSSASLWLDEATAVWAEEKFTTTPNYVSKVRSQLELAPFNGAEKGAANNARYHGYGMSAAIKYLVNNYGEDRLVQIYENIYNGSVPIVAIEQSTEKASSWYSMFLRNYVQGNLYNLKPSFWVQSCNGEFAISTDDDTIKTFSDQYPDLSGRLYKITLAYPDIDSSASLEFTATGGENEITVFRYKSSNMDYLKSGSGNLSIPDIRIMKDEGWNLITLATNKRSVSPYTDVADINLEIKLKEARKYNECFVDLTAKANYERRYHAYPDSIAYIENQTIWEVTVFPIGKFTGNTFKATWDTTHTDGWFERGTLSATVNDSMTKVTEVIINETFGYPEGHSIHSETVYTFKAENIPFDSDWMGVRRFEISGEETYSAIIQLDLTTTTDSYTETLTEYFCNDNSDIVVEFWSPLNGLKKVIKKERFRKNRDKVVKN